MSQTNFSIALDMLGIHIGLWLVKNSHVPGNIQSEWFNSAQCRYAKINFVYDIGSQGLEDSKRWFLKQSLLLLFASSGDRNKWLMIESRGKRSEPRSFNIYSFVKWWRSFNVVDGHSKKRDIMYNFGAEIVKTMPPWINVSIQHFSTSH